MQYFYGMLWLIVVHFVADFILQSDWMAQNKSKSNYALGMHVAAYTITLALGAIPLVFILGVASGRLPLGWIIVNGMAHFATDYVTSRINSRLWTDKKVHWFFVGVGADQVIHYLTLGLTMVWLLHP
jgi:hypothetical protein